MDDDKFLGESSNSNSTTLNNSNRSQHNNSAGNNKLSSVRNSTPMSEEPKEEDDSEFAGWWSCSLCTYKNSNDKFKCEICDLRRGTSTRKPRCNADTIVAQVVKQQEQIRQQTVVKPTKSRLKTSSSNSNIASSSNGPKSRNTNLDTPKGSDQHKNIPTKHNDESDSSNSPAPKRKKTSNKQKHSDVRGNTDGEMSDSGASLDTYISMSRSSELSDAESESVSSRESPSQYLSSPANSPGPTTSSPLPAAKTTTNPFKITPLEINGNLLKYSPPTSSGRTGLIIDKKRFTQHSVTVNEVTITFTEFATRQNRYVRKKKKRKENSRSRNNNGKSRTKNESKPNNGETSPTMAE